MRVLDEDEYTNFVVRYRQLMGRNDDRVDEEFKALADEIERDTYLMGITAVDDKL